MSNETYDRNWLLDFLSLGAWVHQYTATALYHEAQRIPNDKTIAVDDRPRIQAALRAKILVEVAASFDTLGRLCWSIENRGVIGIAAQFINIRKDQATEFYAAVVKLPADISCVIKKLGLPSLTTLSNLPLGENVEDFLLQLITRLRDYGNIYIDHKDTEQPGHPSHTPSLLRQSYNAIKDGSYVIANAPKLIEPITMDADSHAVYIAIRWPQRGDDITTSSLQLVTRSMKQDVVMEDLERIRTVAVIMSNLCQLLIVLLDRNLLVYEVKPDI